MPKAWYNRLVDMLTSRFGALLRNSNWNQHVRSFQPRRALPPDEPFFIPLVPAAKVHYFGDARHLGPFRDLCRCALAALRSNLGDVDTVVGRIVYEGPPRDADHILADCCLLFLRDAIGQSGRRKYLMERWLWGGSGASARVPYYEQERADWLEAGVEVAAPGPLPDVTTFTHDVFTACSAALTVVIEELTRRLNPAPHHRPPDPSAEPHVVPLGSAGLSSVDVGGAESWFLKNRHEERGFAFHMLWRLLDPVRYIALTTPGHLNIVLSNPDECRTLAPGLAEWIEVLPGYALDLLAFSEHAHTLPSDLVPMLPDRIKPQPPPYPSTSEPAPGPSKPLPAERRVLESLYDEATKFIGLCAPLADTFGKLREVYTEADVDPTVLADQAVYIGGLIDRLQRETAGTQDMAVMIDGLIREYLDPVVMARFKRRASHQPGGGYPVEALGPHPQLDADRDPSGLMLAEVRRLQREVAAKLEEIRVPATTPAERRKQLMPLAYEKEMNGEARKAIRGWLKGEGVTFDTVGAMVKAITRYARDNGCEAPKRNSGRPNKGHPPA